jgi:protein zwilch
MDAIDRFGMCVKRLLSDNIPVQFEGFLLEKWPTNHLVTNIVGDQKDCIFASLFVKTESIGDESCIDDRHATVGDQSCVIGSPLKLHDYLKDVQFSIAYSSPTSGSQIKLRPVTANQARCLLSIYNLSYQQWLKQLQTASSELAVIAEGSWPPLWVFCDGQDSSRTAFMSSAIGKTGKNFDGTVTQPFNASDNNMNVMDYYSKDNMTTNEVRFMSGYRISETGPLTDQSKMTNIEALVSEHILKKPHSINCIAKYDLIGRLASSSGTSQVQHQNQSSCGGSSSRATSCCSSVEVTLQWNKPCSLLDEPPLDASAVLLISPVSGDPQSAVYNMYSDLCTLQGFVCGLSEGRVRWAVVDSDIPLIDRVKCLIQDLQLGDATQRIAASSGGTLAVDDSALPLKHIHRPERQDLDFTEHLWNILRDCASYADLVACLQYVVDCLHRGILQPVVHCQNRTKLGELIRESYDGRLDPTILTRLQPLELLVEVGFDKLFRDYTHAFLAEDLVTMTHLSAFICNEAGTMSSVSSRINQLLKLHQVLEMIVLLEQRLKLPHPVLCTITRQALKYYETSELTSQDIFKLPVKSIVISQLLKGSRPKLWQASFVASNANCSEDLHASVAMTLVPNFPHLSLPPVSDTSSDHKRFAGYYVTIANESLAVL